MSETVNIPTHVGLILDGNRRWAKENGLSAFEGHKAGYSNLKAIARHAVERGVKYISAYIFSAENWKRTKKEVKYLLDLALWVANNEAQEAHKENLKVVFMGRREGLSKKLLSAIEKAEDLTRNNTRATLAICFNYSGQQEIVDAAKKFAKHKDLQSLDVADFDKELYAPEVPPIDLLVRTSGEHRISNFMLWRAAYAELYFVNKHWPDFKAQDLDDALQEFSSRQRRFGE